MIKLYLFSVNPCSISSYINHFDSLRGIAALLVFIAHIPNVNQPSLGATGVWLFFVLSGFLLYWFFENKGFKEVAFTIPNYFWRRFCRLIPAYYCSLVIYAIGYSILDNHPKLDWFIRHLSFQEASGHFWSIKVEVLFYLTLPFFMLLFSCFHRLFIKILFSFVSIFIVYYLFEYKEIININAASIEMAPYMTPFFIGIFLSMIRNTMSDYYFAWFYYIGWFGILFLSLDFRYLIVLREVLLPYEYLDNIGWRYPYLTYPFAGMIVLGAYRFNGYWLNNKFMISFGIRAYSFYLWHILVIHAVGLLTSNHYLIFFMALLITYIMAIFSYYFIESVGVHFSKKYQIKLVHQNS